MRARSSSFLIVTALALLSTPIAAQPPALEVEAGFSLAGTPLEIEVTLENWDRAGKRPVEVYLDEKLIGKRAIDEGTHTLRFDEVRPTSGSHTVRVSSMRLRETAEIHSLPGWLSILPPLLAIALALLTRDVLVSLSLGVFGGAMILTGWNPFAAFGRSIDQFIIGALADNDRASIIVFTTLLGGMVGLLTKSGGTHGIIERLRPYATSRRRGMLATWAMGLVVFFDDYANTLIVGPTMRPITDRLKISREKLAYIVDSTAAPVVCLIPISTWVGFEIGLIGDAFKSLALPFDAYFSFVQSIPYRFYPILAIVTVAMVAWTGRDFGPMRRAENRARDEGKVLADDARPIADYAGQAMQPNDDVPKRARNALLPIATVVVVTILGLYVSGSAGQTRGDLGFWAWIRLVLENANSYNALLWASASGVLVALTLPLTQRILTLEQGIGAMVEGFKAMMMALTVLVLAWSLGEVCGELDTAAYLVNLTTGILSPTFVPVLTFVLAAAIAFATGASWGAMAILTPLVIPIFHNLAIQNGLTAGVGAYVTLMSATIASVLSGAVWGDHCSPISDTTILSSMTTGCDHIAHVRTQLPYALGTGTLAIVVGSIPAGVGIRPWLSLTVGIAIILLFFRYLGSREKQAQQTP